MESQMLYEGNRPSEFVTWEVNPAYTRASVEVTAPADKRIAPGTVLVDENNNFVGVALFPVAPGKTKRIAAIVDGAAILILELLIFPTVTDAVDGADDGADNVAENAVATADLQELLILAMADKGIKVRPAGGTYIDF